eukprot:CAMPEP_0117762332 /NCGR_PEP_ID=MMETSP0947-20121206/17867_1 /TAXON_ID=44440 /ORGANISM="Chattonella subsalsa, Strain CCMP2191" /LENGTH=284 /DNA_ID=CAMNT_0005583603 /DNA_START=1 /DNA_END=855 /DNA_ORIENTATION=+
MSVFRNNLFEGKVAIVTGGATGIGLAITQELASLGCNVAVASRKIDICEKVADQLNKSESVTGTVAGFGLNIRDEEAIMSFIKNVLQRFGRVDFLINNAGGQFISPAEAIPSKGFRAVVDTNLTGTFLMCQAAYNLWMKENGGAVVNIVMSNRNGFPLMAHSGAARAAVENMTKTLAVEWVSSGVRINCVSPGIIFTESGIKNYGPLADKLLPKLLRAIPARRLGSPEELSSSVVFLLSEAASYITGTTIDVDGGVGLTFLPLAKIENKSNLSIYGRLPVKAKL